jgi:hypothetical protein
MLHYTVDASSKILSSYQGADSELSHFFDKIGGSVYGPLILTAGFFVVLGISAWAWYCESKDSRSGLI